MATKQEKEQIKEIADLLSSHINGMSPMNGMFLAGPALVGHLRSQVARLYKMTFKENDGQS